MEAMEKEVTTFQGLLAIFFPRLFPSSDVYNYKEQKKENHRM